MLRMRLRRASTIVLVFLVVALAASPASAQQSISRDLIDLVRIRPEEVIAQATGWLNDIGLPRAVENVSWALLLVLFSSQAVRAATVGSGAALQTALVRVLIGGSMLSAVQTVNGWVRDLYLGAYNAGGTVWDRAIQPKLTTSIAQLGAHLATLTAVAQAIAIGGETTIGDVVGLDAVGNTLLNLVQTSARILLFLLAALMGLYLVLQFAAGMLIYLAQVFTPLVAAGLVHERTEGWFGRWIANIIHAALLALLVNVLFGLAVQAGFAGPVERQAQIIGDAVDRLKSISLTNPRAALEALNSVMTGLVITLLLPVTAIAGLIFGVVTMWQAEARVASFIGAMAGGIPMWLPFVRFLGFGKGAPAVGGPTPAAASPAGQSPAAVPVGYEGSRGWFTAAERAEMVLSPPPGGGRWPRVASEMRAADRGWFAAPERAEMVVEPVRVGRPVRPPEEGPPWFGPSERSEI